MKKVFCTIYKSFTAGFSVKLTSTDTITNTKGTTFDAVKLSGDNFLLNNQVYLSFENDQDFKLSVSFTVTTIYKLRQLLRKLVDALPKMFTEENGNLAIAADFAGQVFTSEGAGKKKIALAPAVFQAVEENGAIVKGIAISLNGSDWAYMKIPEFRGICDLVEHLDMVSYQLQLATMMRTCMGAATSNPAIASTTPPAPVNRSSTVFNNAPATPTPVAQPKIVVENKAPYTPSTPAQAKATPTVVAPAQKQTPVQVQSDIDALFGSPDE